MNLANSVSERSGKIVFCTTSFTLMNRGVVLVREAIVMGAGGEAP